MVELKGSCFVLRLWVESDVNSLVRIGNNKMIARNMFFAFPYPYTLKDAKAWIVTANKDKERRRSFAIEVDGKLAGGVELELKKGIREGVADGGYWLGEEFWGRGIASEAWGMIRDYAFENFDVRRFQASAFSWNAASMRVLEKCGLKQEGVRKDSILRFGEVCDDVLYGMTRADWEELK